MNEENINKIRELVESGLRYCDIAELMNVTRNVIVGVCIRHKIIHPKYISPELIEIIRDLANKKLSHKEIAEITGRSRASINHICSKNNISNKYRHGYTNHPLYDVHTSILDRCIKPRNKEYSNYGGRGICVCQGFQDKEYFIEWGIANGWQEGLQCNRIENDGNYSCGHCDECVSKGWILNCNFVTPKENANNTRKNHYLTAFGETKTMTQWSEDERCVVSYSSLRTRIRYNWSVEQALIVPILNNDLSAWGESKSIKSWCADFRSNLTYRQLLFRLKDKKYSTWTTEEKIMTPHGSEIFCQ